MIQPFVYHRPDHLEEALQLLEDHGDDAALYMGGTELVLVMKLGLAAPEHLVDGKRLRELEGVQFDMDELVVGAAVTHRQLELHPDVQQRLPALAELERHVANVRVRNVGTLGGNLCFAEPHSDPATLLIALGSSVDLASRAGHRTLPLTDFIAGPLMTALGPDELLVRVRVPLPPADAHVAYRRIAFRERPVGNVAVVSDGDRTTVVVGAFENTPRRVPEVEAALSAAPDDHDAAVAAIQAAIEPHADLDGSEDYKRHLAGVLLRRALASPSSHEQKDAS